MGILDNAKDKMSEMTGEMKERMEMLKTKESSGNISDTERTELDQMRSKSGIHTSHSGQ